MSESQMKATLNGTNIFGTPWLDSSKIALPGLSGELAEQCLVRAQEGCETIKAASEKMTETLRETFSSNAGSATDYRLKVFEISNANTASALGFFVQLFGNRSASDVFALSAAQARKTFDTASDQNRELWALAQKLATETGKPIRKHITKVLHQAG